MGFTTTTCTVFEDCVQKIAEARLPLKAIGNELGVIFTVDEQTGFVTLNGQPVTFELLVQDPIFQSSTITNKIFNIGFVWGVVAVKVNGIPLTNGCIRVALVFQEEQVACGVLPGDIIDELTVAREGTAAAVVFASSAVSNGKTFRPRVEAVLVLKAAFLVRKIVQRVVFTPVPTCTPGQLLPPCPTICPPVAAVIEFEDC